MDGRTVDLTEDRRLRLVASLKAVAQQGERVMAIKEVQPDRFARVGVLLDGCRVVHTFSVLVLTKNRAEVKARNAKEGDIVFCSDYPCLVQE